jgi:hypothetical protein
MPRTCTVCTHAQRAEIDTALVNSESLRDIAGRFRVSRSALDRHRTDHLPEGLIKAQDAQESADADRVMLELRRILERTNLLFDACDRWLRDPDDPTRYEIGPRAEDVKVTYTQKGDDGRPVKRKKRLSELLKLAGLLDSSGLEVELIEVKHADPRELVLKAAAQSHSNIELLAELIGELKRNPVISVLVSPAWVRLRGTIISALEGFPDAREAVLNALNDGDGNGNGRH